MKTLIEQARKAKEQAYAPYSHFPVGAALLCADGSIYTGCNVEGASFGNTICAERVALVKAISEGKREFVAMAVVADSDEPCTPCGICRQMLYEFTPSLVIYCIGQGEQIARYQLDQDLLPHGFGASFLPKSY